MTKLLKNILNNSENRFLAKQENSFLKTQTDKTGVKRGGAMRDRTADLLRARQALSQLSYGPRINSRLNTPNNCLFFQNKGIFLRQGIDRRSLVQPNKSDDNAA